MGKYNKNYNVFNYKGDCLYVTKRTRSQAVESAKPELILKPFDEPELYKDSI